MEPCTPLATQEAGPWFSVPLEGFFPPSWAVMLGVLTRADLVLRPRCGSRVSLPISVATAVLTEGRSPDGSAASSQPPPTSSPTPAMCPSADRKWERAALCFKTGRPACPLSREQSGSWSTSAPSLPSTLEGAAVPSPALDVGCACQPGIGRWVGVWLQVLLLCGLAGGQEQVALPGPALFCSCPYCRADFSASR